MLSTITKDENRGKEYPAYTVMRSQYIGDDLYKDLSNRTLSQSPKECIFPISATLQLNSAIAVACKNRLKIGLVSLLVDDMAEEEYLIKQKNKDILDQTDSGIRAYLLQPNLQTTLLVSECLALEMKMVNGYVRLTEPPGARKDRYTGFSYLNYYASILDSELLKESGDNRDDEEYIKGLSIFL